VFVDSSDLELDIVAERIKHMSETATVVSVGLLRYPLAELCVNISLELPALSKKRRRGKPRRWIALCGCVGFEVSETDLARVEIVGCGVVKGT